MADLLLRASLVISWLGDRGGAATLGDISSGTALPLASCSRLLNRLQQLGWVERHGRRGGFRLGPRPFALARQRAFCSRLVTAAAPVMAGLSGRLHAACFLSVLHRHRRIMLWETSSGRPRQELSEHDDLDATASGRVLIAHQPPAMRASLVKRLGLPRPDRWPGIETPGELRDVLATIRREGLCEGRFRDGCTIAAAVPDGDGGWAALGLLLPAVRDGAQARRDITASARQVARALSEPLPPR